MAALEVDLSKVEMGQTVTVKWRGKPVFVRRRTETEIEGARAVDVNSLRDPESDEARAKNPEVRLQLGLSLGQEPGETDIDCRECRKPSEGWTGRGMMGLHPQGRKPAPKYVMNGIRGHLGRPQACCGRVQRHCTSSTIQQSLNSRCCHAVARGGWRVHPPGLCAPTQRWRVPRMVLPLPRQPLRHFWPRAQGPSAVQPGGPR